MTLNPQNIREGVFPCSPAASMFHCMLKGPVRALLWGCWQPGKLWRRTGRRLHVRDTGQNTCPETTDQCFPDRRLPHGREDRKRKNSQATCQCRWLFHWQVSIVKYGETFSPALCCLLQQRHNELWYRLSASSSRAQTGGDRKSFWGTYHDSSVDVFFKAGGFVGKVRGGGQAGAAGNTETHLKE